jgi:hypothetical protein
MPVGGIWRYNHLAVYISLLPLLSGKNHSESWTHWTSLLKFQQSRESGFGCLHLKQRMAAGTGAGVVMVKHNHQK